MSLRDGLRVTCHCGMDYVLHVTAGWITCYMSLREYLKHLSYFAEVKNKFQMTALTMQSKAKNFAQLWETLSCLHYSFPLVT